MSRFEGIGAAPTHVPAINRPRRSPHHAIFVALLLLAAGSPTADASESCTDTTVLTLKLDPEAETALESSLEEACVQIPQAELDTSCGVVQIESQGSDSGHEPVPCPFDAHAIHTAIGSLTPVDLRTAVTAAFDWYSEGGAAPYLERAADGDALDDILDPSTLIRDLEVPAHPEPTGGGSSGGYEDYLANGQCRTAETTASEGEWSIIVPTDHLGAAQHDFDSFASVGTVSLDFPDHGHTYQEICYHPGGWEPQAGTEVPSGGGAGPVAGCAAGGAMFIAGAALVVAGASQAPTPWGVPLVIAGIGLAGAGLGLAATNCTEIGGDDGWMHCTGGAKVSWGGEGGNSYESELLDDLVPGDLLELTAVSHGPGYREERFPVLHNGPGYWKGVAACDSQLEQSRLDAYSLYQTWGTTASGSEAATSTITARVAVDWSADDADLLGCPETGLVLATNACLIGGVLLVGCESTQCAPEVVLSVEACGKQTLTAGHEQTTYGFTGKLGCLSISLEINGAGTTIEDIPLRLDARFKGQGGGSWTDSSQQL